MAKAASWFAPQIDDLVEKVGNAKNWGAPDKQKAHDWYNHFLEANWNQAGSEINVLNDKADDLWHEHILNTQRYTNYCLACFGYYLDHFPDVRRKPTKAELDAVQPAYSPNWPVPDSIVSCHS
jgi:hypothetical protein